MRKGLFALLAATICGCPGPGPDADEGRSLEEVRERARNAGPDELDRIIEDYERAIEEADSVEEKAELGVRLVIYEAARLEEGLE